MTLQFTTAQIDHICYQIGEWYIQWEQKMWVDGKPNHHWLGFAKEELKTLICGDTYEDNSAQHKSTVEILQERLSTLQEVAIVLGIAHGAIYNMLNLHDSELRPELVKLDEILRDSIGHIFYEERH